MVIHDLVDHDLVMERKTIGATGRCYVGKLKPSSSVWRTALKAVGDHRRRDYRVTVRNDNVDAIARARVEPELDFGDCQVLAGCEGRTSKCVLTAVRRSDDVAGQIHWCRAMIHQLKPKLPVGRRSYFIDCESRGARLQCVEVSTRPAYRRPERYEDQFSTAALAPSLLILARETPVPSGATGHRSPSL